MCTTFQGLVGKVDACNGSGVFALLFAWHGNHLSIILLAILSMFGNLTFLLAIVLFSPGVGGLHERDLALFVADI